MKSSVLQKMYEMWEVSDDKTNTFAVITKGQQIIAAAPSSAYWHAEFGAFKAAFKALTPRGASSRGSFKDWWLEKVRYCEERLL